MSLPTPTDAPRRKRSFIRAFLESVLGTGLSRILGALRDVALASVLGAGTVSDTFWIAYTAPNLLRRFVADEGLTGALIPALAQAEADGEDPKQMASGVLGALILANVILVAGGIWMAPAVVTVLAPSYLAEPETFELAVTLTRWLFPFVACVSLVSYFEGLLNHRGHFFVPKIAPGVVSLGIVAAAVVATLGVGEPVYVVVVGVLAGGVAHVLVNLPVVFRKWGSIGPSLALHNPRVRAVLRELAKVVAIGVFAQLNIIVLRQVATSLESGALTWYQYATRFIDLAQGIVAVGIGSAMLPGVSQAVAEQAWDELRQDIVRAFRLAAFLIFPAGAISVCFAEPLTSLMYRHGRFTFSDVQQTASVLQVLLPFLICVAGMNLLKKVFFALEDRGTLLKVGAAGVCATGVFGYVLGQRFGVVGLGVALSIATTGQMVAYLWVLHRRIGDALGLRSLIKPLFQMALASTAPGVILLFAAPLGSWELGPLSALNWGLAAVALCAAALAYIAAAWLLGIEELHEVWRRLRRRLPLRQ